jgi:LCP family protein required for cell wall assembly
MTSQEEPTSSRGWEVERARGRRRARGLAGTLGVTLMGAVAPGAGYLFIGRRLLGLAVLLPTLLLVGAGVWYFGRDLDTAIDVAFDPSRLKIVAAALTVGVLAWVTVLVSTYVMVRPAQRTRVQTFLGASFVVVLVACVAGPVAIGAHYAMVQADLVSTIFTHNQSATAPRDVSEKDPWGGRSHVNVLLLGGDGAPGRYGVRTDSVILLSMDTRTGRTVMFSLPRNMMNAQFPAGSPLHDIYPDGFAGEGDPANWMLNALYDQVPALHPGILGHSDNEGADAVKQAVSGSLGLSVDYYVLVNLAGFEEIVNAMGGVTVNVNVPVPIGGRPGLGVPPESYLQPGPNQRLDGFHALWFSRGRYGSDDYQRMERQRCVINAIIDEADPLTLLRRYERLADVGKRIVRTDIPRELMPAFVDLALKIKDARVRSVVFRSSDKFFSGDPDFEWMRSVVRRALTPHAHSGHRKGPADPGTAVDAQDVCAYAPVG